MPTQRPFLSNFLAAFRAHSPQIQKSQPSISSSGVAAASSTNHQTIWTSSQPTSKAQSQNSSSSDVSSPRQIPPQKQNAYSTSATAAQPSAYQEKQYHALQHNVSPQTHLPRSPPSPGLPVYGPQNKPQPNYPTPQESRPWADHSRKSRRGSDSSSEGGFREVKGAGWFVGGRNAQGEEKYYKLSMVKRDRSSDRISADQLSL